MTYVEFIEVMAWLSAAIGKPIAEGSGDEGKAARQARLNVYFDCLGDIPIDALRLAAKRCAMERKYQSFPPIAELREMAFETTRGEVKAITGQEAWGIAMRVVGKFDVAYSEAHKAAILAEMPPIVHAAVQAFGFMALYNLPNGAIETARAQFIKTFESIAEREKKTGILPAPVQEQIAAIGEREANPALEHARAGVFKAIEG